VVSLDRAIRRRRMVRRYVPDRPVPADIVDELVHYGLRAPSAGFTQGVSFLILTGDSVRRFWAVSSCGSNSWLTGMVGAPVLVLVWTDRGAYERRYAEPDKRWAVEDQPWTAPFWYVDAGMAAQNILLGAADRGLGACFFGVPLHRLDAVRAEFGVPQDQLSVGVISLGWPADDERPTGSVQRRPRTPADTLVHRGHWVAGAA
jgi:nitroreductase